MRDTILELHDTKDLSMKEDEYGNYIITFNKHIDFEPNETIKIWRDGNKTNEEFEKGKEAGIRQVGKWIKYPYRKGMKMSKNIDGGVGIMSAGCEVCGGKLVYIRGPYPGTKKRKVCPTCATEIIESLSSNCNNRDSATNTKV